MSAPSLRTLIVTVILLGAGLFALGGSALIPGLPSAERGLIGWVARVVDGVTSDISGEGSAESPWMRRKPSPVQESLPPRILMIDDDSEGWFSASPLAPIDHALILARLADAGHRNLGVGHLMAWDEPDSLAMEALRKQLDRFDSAVLALPLARGAAPDPVAAPFVRWSVAENRIAGNAATLPKVNRLAVSGAEVGGDRTLAGFSVLENERDPGDGRQPLLAQWGNTIIFAFPLAVEIAALGLQPEDVQIHVGQDIRLGASGPVIPIDEFGRGPVTAGVEAIEAPAMRLFSEDNPLPPTRQTLLTRDAHPGMSPAESSWSEGLAGSVQAIRTAPTFSLPEELKRMDPLRELALMLVIVVLAAWAASQRHFGWRLFTGCLVAAFSAELIYLFAERRGLWLPPLAMLVPAGLAAVFAFVPVPDQKVSALTEPVSNPEIVPATAVEPFEAPPEIEAEAPLTSLPDPPLPSEDETSEVARRRRKRKPRKR